MTRNISIDQTGFTIDQIEIPLGLPILEATKLLGAWDRIYEGQYKAPAGYKNNLRYIYDNLGISLLDHWTDRRLVEVTFHYCPHLNSLDGPRNAFQGALRLCGRCINTSDFWIMIDNSRDLNFRHLLNRHIGEIGPYYICVSELIKNCRNVKLGRIADSLSVSFRVEQMQRGH